MCTDCMGMDILTECCHVSDHVITLNLESSVHSKEKKTVECGNHYNVSFIMIHTKTESPVNVQTLNQTIICHGFRYQLHYSILGLASQNEVVS